MALSNSDSYLCRHIQVFGDGKCLVAVDDLVSGRAKMYIEDDNYMLQAIEEAKTKKMFDLTRIGEDYLFTVNESKRLMALCTKRDVSPLVAYRTLILMGCRICLVPTIHLCDRRALPQHAISQC